MALESSRSGRHDRLRSRAWRIGNLRLTFAERAVYWMVWCRHNPCHCCNYGCENMDKCSTAGRNRCSDSLGEPGFFDAAAQSLAFKHRPGQVNLGWRGRAKTRAASVGRSRWCRMDAQDAQRVPTSRHCVTSTAKTRSIEKAERLDEGLGCIKPGFWILILAPQVSPVSQTQAPDRHQTRAPMDTRGARLPSPREAAPSAGALALSVTAPALVL
jgi:hypothetical protein